MLLSEPHLDLSGPPTKKSRTPLRLEKIDTDHYRRAWYLCLFEAIEAVLSGRHKQEFHQQHRAYRNSIGHPTPSTTMDGNEFARLQHDALAELRRILLGN